MKVFFRLLFVLLPTLLAAQKGYEIKVQIPDFDQKELYLGYYLLDKQYILDTTQIDANGVFTFAGEEPLAGGVYLVVLPPNNAFFQILLDTNDQHFSILTGPADNPTLGLKVKGSPNNEVFYDYLNLLMEKTPVAEEYRKELEAAGEDQKAAEKAEKKLEELNQEIKQYQLDLVKNNPGKMVAALIAPNIPMDIPAFDAEGQELEVLRWQYTKQHYFDQFDLGDPRLLRTPLMFQRIDHFVNKLTVQHPDSINQSLFFVLERCKPAEETFKYYLVHFLNTYAKSKIVGFDAIYVFLAEQYYASGQAPWTDEEQLAKIIDNAQRIKPLLLGKIAPNILMQTREGKEVWLHDFQSPYTVLVFWAPDCGHCKKTMPELDTFYEQFKDKGVEVFAVCSKFYNELDSCWKFIDENNLNMLFHVVDPYHRSKYKTVYDIQTTPQVYILDQKKEILSKKIGIEQLPEVMQKIIDLN